MANQERPGTPGIPEIDDPATPHPSRKDREIQDPSPRTTPIDNPKVRANEKRGTTPDDADEDSDTATPQRPGRGDVNSPDHQRRADEGGRENDANPAQYPERRTSTDRTGNR